MAAMAQTDASAYYCPMHADVRQAAPGQCSKCGMDLVPEGARFGLLRHMLGQAWHLALMIAAMLALMAAAMKLLH